MILRWFKYLILGAIMLAIVLVALANRDSVTLELLPAPLFALFPVSVKLPLFVVILLAVLSGLLIGYVLEWLREAKHRRRASEKAREASRLEREVSQLKKTTMSERDEILSLLN